MRDKAATDALLDKLERQLHAPDFSESERAALHEMVNAWRGWQQLGRFAKWLIVGLGLIATAVASLTTLSAAAKEVIRSWLA